MERLNKFTKIKNYIYYNIFVERFTKKINFKFPSNFYRWDMIKFLQSKKQFKNYLEIGCDQDQLFSKINIENKIGVDPVSGGNTRKSSDDFFSTNKINFDLVFIDGLHEYDQVKKDILNSLKFLNPNGIILVHDCLPSSMSKQAVPRYRMSWNGDVWKAIVDLRCEKNIEIFTCEIDQGIAIIQNKNNTDLLSINKKPIELKFHDFYNNYKKYMRVISLEDFKKIFS
tara:strand:+ start:484 stop:1164 length:681 start_codon:yes stop_codon:yes gene_type:complete